MTTDTTAQTPATSSALIPMTIIGVLFFVFGFVTWLNGALIPFLKIVCELNEFQALFVTFAFYIAYTVMALPAALVLRRTGYKIGMVVGLGIMLVGALGFIPAAQSGLYPLFLVALFVLGSGMTLLQTAANPYVVCIGPRESAAVRMSIMGLMNKGAGIVAPAVFTIWIMSDAGQFEESVLMALGVEERAARLAELSNRLVVPYLYMALVLLVLMVAIYFSSLPDLETDTGEDDNEGASVWGIFKYPQAILGALALFMYVGVEVIAADTIGLFGRRLGVEHFSSLTSYTMAFMVVGYLIGMVLIPRYINQAQALMGSALLGIAFVFGTLYGAPESEWVSTVFFFGWTGFIPTVPDTVAFIALLGLANALCWPAIWPMSLEDLGKYTSVGSALLIMGIAGGALMPLVYGYFAEATNNHSAYWVMVPCYAFILFYALKGHKMRRWKS